MQSKGMAQRRVALIMNIAADGPNVTRVTPAQPSRFSSYAPWSQGSCCKVSAHEASLLDAQARLQVSVANHNRGPHARIMEPMAKHVSKFRNGQD